MNYMYGHKIEKWTHGISTDIRSYPPETTAIAVYFKELKPPNSYKVLVDIKFSVKRACPNTNY